MMGQEIVLKIEKLCKSFGPTRANINVDFTLRKGEVRGLVGENGSGKSTLLSQIAGMYPSDSGEMYLFGERYAPKSPLEANRRGVGIVVQEFGVIGSLPAGVNVYLGHTKQFKTFGIIHMRRLYHSVRELEKKWELPDIPLTCKAGEMHVESRKMVELLRALSVDPQILILDEVTQALSLNNRKKLYEVIRRYKEMGRSVILISHDLEELVEITDTLTVLRDGEVVTTVDSGQTSVNELKRLMVGRAAEGGYYRTDTQPSRQEQVVLEVRDLSVERDVQDVSFDVHAGEIVGLCGLSDSGIHAVGRALYGLGGDVSGTILLKQRGVQIKNSQTALKNRMAYVPKERDGEGLMIKGSIMENFCLPSLKELEGTMGFLSKKKRSRLADDAREQYAVRCRNVYQRVSSLSGGNKQKINLGRWMTKELDLVILDCPTRGVDVGVKAYIYDLMKKAKADGLAIVLISDELTEALGMSDRLLVFNNGRIAKEIARGSEFSEESVIEVMI